jgi:hypothetical protein
MILAPAGRTNRKVAGRYRLLQGFYPLIADRRDNRLPRGRIFAMRHLVTGFLWSCLCASLAAGDTAADPAALAAAGRTQEAFAACLAVPGLGHAAVRLGRPLAETALGWLDAAAVADPVEGEMVRCDLLLAIGRREAALAACRQAAGWLAAPAIVQPPMPHGYPVEPPPGTA